MSGVISSSPEAAHAAQVAKQVARQKLVELSTTGAPEDQQEALRAIAEEYCDRLRMLNLLEAGETVETVFAKLQAIRQRTHEYLERLVGDVVSAATPAAPVVDRAAVEAAAAAAAAAPSQSPQRRSAAPAP